MLNKTYVALLVAAVVSSPMALANTYYSGFESSPSSSSSPSYGGSSSDSGYYKPDHKSIDKKVEVKDSFNKDVKIDVTKKQDNDTLNVYKKDIKIKDSFNYTDNDDYSETWTIDADIAVAASTLKGKVTYNMVNYGACCSYNPSLTVTHTNDMTGVTTNGVAVLAQSSGHNSLVQQSVATNANVNNNPAPAVGGAGGSSDY